MRNLDNLQPTSKKLLIFLLSTFLLSIETTSFTFSAANVGVSNNQINAIATYTFILRRNYNDLLNPTDWNTTNVPSNATSTITFPAQFTTSQISAYSCDSVTVNGIQVFGFTCSISGNTIIISNLFSGSDLVSQVDITLGNIVNPSSALTTSPFIATIGSDTSSNSAIASTNFAPGLLTDLTITFQGGIVNRTSDMIFSFTTGDSVPANGVITIQFPPTLLWARQLATTYLIPINGALSCYGKTAQVKNDTLRCSGSFSTGLVTVSTFLSSTLPANKVVSFGISGIFAPPTTEPVDSLTVSTCDNSINVIGAQSATITGLLPQTLSPYSMQSSLSTPIGVNNFAAGLTFTFTLTDTISFRDYFLITFPTGTTISYSLATSTIRIINPTYTASNLSLVLFQNTTNPNYPAGTSITITFIKYKAPPSTKPSGPITFTILNNAFAKMSASATITAIANNYNLSVLASSNVVNVLTSYNFSFTMADPLTSSGYFLLILDPKLCTSNAQKTTVTTNLMITVSGTNIRSSPSTQISAFTVSEYPTYVLLISNLNTSLANIPAQTITITVSNILNPSSVTTLTSFSLSTYYSSSADLVANANYAGSISMQPGVITLNSITSTATTTYTFTTITIIAKNTNPVSANGYLIVTIPSDITLLSASKGYAYLFSTPISSNFTNFLTNNSILLIISSTIAANSTITLALNNIMTQNTTKITNSFAVSTYDSTFSAIDQSTNSLGLSVTTGNNFNSLTLTRGSSVNSKATNYTIIFQQTQSFTSVSVFSLKFNNLLSLSSLSRIYEVTNTQTVACLFTRVNSTYVKVTLSQSATSIHKIIIQQVTNPPSQAPLTQPILFITSTPNYLYTYSQMYTEDIINTEPSALTVDYFTFSSYVFAESTDLGLSVTTLATWPAFTYQLIINIPSGLDITNALCSSNITNLGCSFFAPTNTLTVSMTNSASLPVKIIFQIKSLIAPSYGSSPQSFTLTSFDNNGYKIQTDNSTIIFANNCSLSCRTCSTTNISACLSCYSSQTINLTLLYRQKCLSVCPSIAYQQNLTCIDCSSQCLTCALNSANCLTCNVNSSFPLYYFSANLSLGTCLNSCNSGTYHINQTCLDCSSICKNCNSSDYCFQCQPTYFFYNRKCLSYCPNNTITNTTNSSCTQCLSPCSSCINTVSTCLTCIPGTVLFNNSCSSTCPLPNLFITINQTCDLCDSQCATCSLVANNCTSCNLASNYTHLHNNKCLNACPQLFYSNSTTLNCQSCSSLGIGCSNCSSPTTCLTCDSPFFYFPLNQSCLNSTPNGYFNINGTLYACNSTCNSCSVSFSNCTSCSGNLSLYQNQCVTTCPLNVTVSINNYCTYCSYPCNTCINTTSSCLSCALNSSLYYDSSLSCVNSSSCPNSTFSDNSTYKCLSCNASCTICSGSSTNCSKCASSYYLVSSNNSCETTCPIGTVTANTSFGGICQTCSYPCLTCSGINSFCTSCSQVNKTLFLNNNGSCVANTSCQLGTYADSTTFICETCVSPCSTCFSASSCLSCQANYSLIASNNTCSTTCPSGYAPKIVNVSSICTLCLYPCSTCSINISTCMSCAGSSSLYLQGNQCVNASSCIVGTYANTTNNICQSCYISCSACSSLLNCSNCSNNYYLYSVSNSCLEANQCPNGTVSGYNSTSGKNQCLTCAFPCQTCSLATNSCTSCLQSNGSLFLLNNSCVNSSTCPSGTFANSTSYTCSACISPCSKCTSATACTTCITDYFLNGTKCLGLCPSGTYVLNQSGIIACVSCNSTCETCSISELNCTSCSNNSYLLNNICVNSTSCPQGTFANSNTSVCSSCISPCMTCLHSSFCLSCINNTSLYTLTGSCFTTCPNGTISINVSNILTCVTCSLSCGTCIFGVNNCTSCSNSSQYIYNGTCYGPSLCPNGTFSNNVTNSCTVCSSPCHLCANVSQCISCAQNYYLLNTQCLSACPNTTVNINTSITGICQACSYPCQTCINLNNNCTSCIQSNQTQLFFYNNSCYNSSSCPQKTYQSNQSLSCINCVSPCLHCFSATLCSSCVVGYYYNQNYTCLSSCPSGTVAINLTTGGVCEACIYPCSQCSVNASNCKSCSQTNGTLYLLNGQCVANTSCSDNTYANSSNFKCEICASQCSECTAINTCTTCTSNFYLNGSSCLSTCPNGTLAQNVSFGGSCQSCSYPCKTCSNYISSCTSCSQINSTLYLTNNSCLSSTSCPNGTYPSNTTFKCQVCSSQCLLCVSNTSCLSCNLAFYFNNFTCISLCPSGTVASNSTSGGVCQNCTYPCIQCSGTTTFCTVCSQTNSSLFSSNGSCVNSSSCQNGTYANTSTLKCQKCVSSCTSCSSYSYCSTCNIGFYYDSSQCVSTCPDGKIANNSTQTCLNCLSPCKFCSINQTFCLSCISPYLFYAANNTCLTACPDYYYADTSLLQCKSCFSPCFTCSSSQACKSCLSGFFLFTNSSCIADCPSGYFNNNNDRLCSICVNNCSTCTSATVCISCSPPYLFNNNLCGTTCPISTSYNISNKCGNCSEAVTGCLSCNSSNLNNPICVTCQSPLVLSQGKCVTASSGIDSTLSASLKTSSIFPLPFTITSSIIFIACFMSKLQNKNSYVIGTAYSLFGFIQSACLIYTIIIYSFYLSNNNGAQNYQVYLQAGLLIIGALNLFGLFVQTYQLYKDEKFAKWARSTCNYCCYIIITILSCLFNYKFKMLIFTKLFSFYCLRAQLQSVQKFRVFNVMSFLGVGHQGLIIYISAIIMATLPTKQQTFISFLDLVIVNVLNIGLALAVSSKQQTFFQQEQEDGIKINKVFNAYDSYDVNQLERDDQKKGKNKEKGLQSRDMMVDEDDDDQFTLSISDRDTQNINDQTNAKIVSDSIHRNKSAIIDSESNHEHQQTGNSLKRPKGQQPSLNLYSNNFSAVYQGDLSREKRKKFEQSHELSKQIAEKSKHSESEHIQEQDQEENFENKPQNIFDVKGQFEEQTPVPSNYIMFEEQNIPTKQQNLLKNEKGGNNLQEFFNDFQVQQVLFDQKSSNRQNLQSKVQNDPVASNQENIKINSLNPSSSQAIMIPAVSFQRQIKVYKGKQPQQQQEDDIQEIDLTISKKQKELIQLRKSIRKKQRERQLSQERKSRKGRSSSKDKRSRHAMSQLGLVPPKSKEILTNRGQQPSSRLEIIQQMESSKSQVDEQLIAPVTMTPQNPNKKLKNKNTDIIQQEVNESKMQTISKKQVQIKQEQLQSSIIIDQTKDVKVQNKSDQPPMTQFPEQQINAQRSGIANNGNNSSNIHSFSNNFFTGNESNNEKIKSKEQTMNLVNLIHNVNSQELPKRDPKVIYQKIDKQLDSKYQISPRNNQIQYDIQDMNRDFNDPDEENVNMEQNIFQYKKQQKSFISLQAQYHEKHKLVGFISKPHRKIQKDNDKNEQIHQEGLQFNVAPDTENNPLDNKMRRKSKQSIYSGNNSFKNNEDALDEIIDKTSRNQISKNRSHLIRKNEEFEQRESSLDRKNNKVKVIPTLQSRLYQDLNDALTIRQTSEKEFTQRKLIMNRPPLQNQRPATTQKSRMYIAGLRQMQSGQEQANTLRSSLDNSSLKNGPVPSKTSYNMNFRGMKSKELQQQGESKFQIYPSSFSSNRIQLGSEELSRQPNKPTISRTARINQPQANRQRQEESRLNDSFARKSMKSYKSKSIDREQYLQQQNLANSRKKSVNKLENENDNDDLNQYYKRVRDTPSKKSRKSRSRSKSREADRSSDRKTSQLEKIYLQRFQFKK